MKYSAASENILTGNLLSLMVRLSLPATMGMMLIAINILVDMIFVGHYVGDSGIAAISISSTYTSILFALSMLVGDGSSSLLSRAIGSKDKYVQGLIFGNMAAMSIIAGIALFILSLFSKELLSIIGAEGEVLELGTDYLFLSLAGGFLNVIGIGMNWMIRAEGKIGIAMIFTGLAMLINIVIDAILIAGLDMGTRGAAIASILAWAIYTALNLIYFLRGNASFQINLRNIGIKKEIIRDVLSTGFASFLLNITSLVQFACVFCIISNYSNAYKDAAIFGAAMRLYMILIIPAYGLVRAFQPIAGINYGAGSYKRIKDSVWIFTSSGIAFTTLIWIPLMLFPAEILHIISPDFILLPVEITNIRIFFMLFPLHSIVSVCVALLQSMGHGKTSTYLSLTRQILIFIPLIFLLTHFYAINGVYYTYFISELLITIICLFIFKYQFNQFDKKDKITASRI